MYVFLVIYAEQTGIVQPLFWSSFNHTFAISRVLYILKNLVLKTNI